MHPKTRRLSAINVDVELFERQAATRIESSSPFPAGRGRRSLDTSEETCANPASPILCKSSSVDEPSGPKL